MQAVLSALSPLCPAILRLLNRSHIMADEAAAQVEQQLNLGERPAKSAEELVRSCEGPLPPIPCIHYTTASMCSEVLVREGRQHAALLLPSVAGLGEVLASP